MKSPKLSSSFNFGSDFSNIFLNIFLNNFFSTYHTMKSPKLNSSFNFGFGYLFLNFSIISHMKTFTIGRYRFSANTIKKSLSLMCSGQLWGWFLWQCPTNVAWAIITKRTLRKVDL
jgi:hypothetical protein